MEFGNSLGQSESAARVDSIIAVIVGVSKAIQNLPFHYKSYAPILSLRFAHIAL